MPGWDGLQIAQGLKPGEAFADQESVDTLAAWEYPPAMQSGTLLSRDLGNGLLGLLLTDRAG